MRKIYSLLLMATMLLISGNMWAEAVCQIGSKTYETLKAAIAEVPTDATETTITVLTGFTEAEPGGKYGQIEIAAGKNIVLDLNGKVVDLNYYHTAQISLSGKLTIKSSVSGGELNSLYSTSTSLISCKGGSELTLISGKLTDKGSTKSGKVITTANGGSTFTMNGGEIVAKYIGVDVTNFVMNGGKVKAQYIAVNGAGVINNGTIESVTKYAVYASKSKNSTCSGILVINGGTFVGATETVEAYLGDLEINGGVFTPAVVGFAANAASIVNVGASMPQSLLVNTNAEVYDGEVLVGYTSLNTAIMKNSKVANKTVKLTKPVTLTSGSNELIKKGFILDLNEQTLTYSATATWVSISSKENLIIKNGTIIANKMAATGSLMDATTGGCITLDNVNLTTTGSAFYPKGDAASIYVKNSEINAGAYGLATNASSASHYGVIISVINSTIKADSKNNDGCGICLNVAGTLTIDNSEIEGVRQGLLLRAGSATVTNSTIKQTYAEQNDYTTKEWSQGNEVPTSALVIGNYGPLGTTSKGATMAAYRADARMTLLNTKLYAAGAIPTVYMDANDTYGSYFTYDSNCEFYKNNEQKCASADYITDGQHEGNIFHGFNGTTNEVVADLCSETNVTHNAVGASSFNNENENMKWNEANNWSSDVLPTTDTPVQLASNQNVVVESEGGISVAEAYSLVIPENSSVTVKAGATLVIGAGGIANAAGENGLVVEDGAQLVINPANKNLHPVGTIKYVTKGHKFADPEDQVNDHAWDFMAIPTMGQPEITNVSGSTYYINKWNTAGTPWEALTSLSQFSTPFQGYSFTNDNAAAGAEYIFKGALVGANDQSLKFNRDGFFFYGNSYTSPIDILTLLNDQDGENIDRQVILWNTEAEKYVYITKAKLLAKTAEVTEIAPMQGFFMYSAAADEAGMDYTNAVWNSFLLKQNASAPKRAASELIDVPCMKVTIARAAKSDEVYFFATDNTIDYAATKMPNAAPNINVYAKANASAADMYQLAVSDINNTILGFTTGKAAADIAMSLTFNSVAAYSSFAGDGYALYDAVEGTTTTITDGLVYNFTVDATDASAHIDNRFMIVELTHDVTIGAAGWATYCDDAVLGLPAGLQAYKAAYNAAGEELLLTEVSAINANEGVILKGAEGGYDFTAGVATDFSGNELTGTVDGEATPAGEVYCLHTQGGVTGFYKYVGANIPAHKAYFILPAATPAPSRVRVRIVSATTGVEEVSEMPVFEKYIENGNLYLQSNDCVVNAQGQVVK